MSVLVNVRVPEHVRDTWKAEAAKLGVTLSDFVKGAVETKISRLRVGHMDPAPITKESLMSIPRPAAGTTKRSYEPDWKSPVVKKKSR